MKELSIIVCISAILFLIAGVQGSQWDGQYQCVSTPPLAQPGCGGCTYINGTVVNVAYNRVPDELEGTPVLAPISILNGTGCPNQAAPFQFRVAGDLPLPNTLMGQFYGLNATYSLVLRNETAANESTITIVDENGCETVLRTIPRAPDDNEGDKVKKDLIKLVDKYFLIAAIVCGVLCALSVTYPCLPCCVACIVACCSPCILLALMLTFLLAENDTKDFINDQGK